MSTFFCPSCGNKLTAGDSLLVDGGTRIRYSCPRCLTEIDVTYPINIKPADYSSYVDFVYEGEELGRFIVEQNLNDYDTFEDAATAADEIATEQDGSAECIDTCSKEEGDALGYDTF